MDTYRTASHQQYMYVRGQNSCLGPPFHRGDAVVGAEETDETDFTDDDQSESVAFKFAKIKFKLSCCALST